MDSIRNGRNKKSTAFLQDACDVHDRNRVGVNERSNKADDVISSKDSSLHRVPKHE